MCSRMILWSQPDFAAKALHVKFWIISARSKSKVDKVTASKQVSLEIGEKQEVHMVHSAQKHHILQMAQRIEMSAEWPSLLGRYFTQASQAVVLQETE